MRSLTLELAFLVNFFYYLEDKIKQKKTARQLSLDIYMTMNLFSEKK